MSRKKIRVGVVGVGYLGKLHAEKYALIEDAELVGVTDVNHARAREIASLTGSKAFDSYADLFGKVDAVSIVTPTESHCRIGLEFLGRGIDVLVEKPIANSTKEADALIQEAAKKNAILQVGHLERFNAAYAALSGRVKRPVYLEAHRLSPFPNRSTDVDVVLDVMIHDIDIVLNLAGSEVESVEAAGTPVVSNKVDIANARLRFKNGCVASLTGSRVARSRVRKLEITERDACYTVDFMNQQLFISKLVPGKDGAIGTLADEEIVITKRDSILEELKSFVSSSAERKAPYVSGTDGRSALAVAERIQNAIASSIAGLKNEPA
ncbi:MAG: Gfo/Idh/MocA family oxidoreductase [Deltaproteobacteria bacterium]|nr:Gfo/Idh/MocA family oxidoreductase [Deltaproteobacteria bacterium]